MEDNVICSFIPDTVTIEGKTYALKKEVCIPTDFTCSDFIAHATTKSGDSVSILYPITHLENDESFADAIYDAEDDDQSYVDTYCKAINFSAPRKIVQEGLPEYGHITLYNDGKWS